MRKNYPIIAITVLVGCASPPTAVVAPPANPVPAAVSAAAPAPSLAVQAAPTPAVNDAAPSGSTGAARDAVPAAGDSVDKRGALPQVGTIRGTVKTHPAQSAQYAVVYLENGPLEKTIDTKIDDEKMAFVPYVSVMTVGGKLTYVNSEPFPDTAFSLSNEKWDFGMVEAHGRRTRTFENAGYYTVLCHLHPNELAFLLVLPSSFIARADKKGEYVMPNVPAGDYELVAWAPRVKKEIRKVTVANGELSADFDLKH